MTQKPNPLSSIKVSGPIPAHLARSVIEETLRSAILDGRLPCGTALRQQDLADLFGVSRMPVREALRQLEAQSLAPRGRTQRRGGRAVGRGRCRRNLCPAHPAGVRSPAPVDSAARRRRSLPRLQPLSSTTWNTDRLCRDRPAQPLFHMALYRKAPNQRLLSLVEERPEWKRNAFCASTSKQWAWARLSQEDHRELLRAAQARDIALTVTKLQHHLNRGVEVITRYLNSLEPQGKKSST